LFELEDPVLKDIINGCCDVLVVTTGTLSACGVNDIRPVEIVDENNLDKFIWTQKQRIELLKDNNDYIIDFKYALDITGDKFVCVVKNKDGKIIKPLNHQKPNLEAEIKRQENL